MFHSDSAAIVFTPKNRPDPTVRYLCVDKNKKVKYIDTIICKIMKKILIKRLN